MRGRRGCLAGVKPRRGNGQSARGGWGGPRAGAGGARPGAGRKPASKEQGSLYRERLRKERALASIREHQLQRLRNEWDAEKIRETEDVLRRVRAGVLAIPRRVGARRPDLTREDVEAIRQEVELVLTLLADGQSIESN